MSVNDSNIYLDQIAAWNNYVEQLLGYDFRPHQGGW